MGLAATDDYDNAVIREIGSVRVILIISHAGIPCLFSDDVFQMRDYQTVKTESLELKRFVLSKISKLVNVKDTSNNEVKLRCLVLVVIHFSC